MLPFEGYELGFCVPVPKQRYHNYRAGLLDCNEIAVLYQDMIEANCVPEMCADHAFHFIQMGLCRIPDQMPYH